MARVYFFIVMTIIMSMLINYSGVTHDSSLDAVNATAAQNSSSFLQQVGLTDSSSPSSSSFIVYILAILGATTVLGIVVGFFYGGRIENFMMLGLISGTLIPLAATLMAVTHAMATAPAYMYYPVYILMGAFTVGFVFSCVEWFRGNI